MTSKTLLKFSNLLKIGLKTGFLVFWISIAVFHSSLFSGTTGILEGIVLDKATMKPLAGVNVFILETRQGSATNQNGFFKIHNVRSGTYRVRVSMIGYRMLTFNNITIIPDLKVRLNVELTESPIEMDAIEVRAERPLIQTDVKGTVYELSAQKMNQLPIEKFQEVVGLQAGTTVEGNVRGGKIREVIYLIDGLPVQDVIRGGLGSELPISAISQLSVKTGGFDAEYGNALSGVVNVITQTGSNEHRFFLRADNDHLFGGTQASKATNLELSAGGPIKNSKLYYFLANNLFLSDTRWWQDFQYFFDSPIQNEINGLGKIDWHLNPSMRMSAQILYSLNRWRDYEFSWRYNLNGLPPQQRNSFRTALFWTHTLSQNTFYSVSLSQYYLNSKIGEGAGEDIEGIPYQYDFYSLYIVSGDRVLWANMKQLASSMKAEITNQFHPRHEFKAGFELKHYNVDSDVRKMEPQKTYFGKPLVLLPLLNYSSRYHYYPRSGSIFIQDKFESGKNQSGISVGLRFDFLDPRASRPAVELVPVKENEYRENLVAYKPAKIQYNLSPRFGFSFPITEKSHLFINYGHYIQYPLFEHLYSGLDNVNLRYGVNVLRGNPNLLAEKTRAWEISARHNAFENVVVSALYFKKETTDQIDTKTFVPSNSRIAGDYGFCEYVNNPYAISHGFEFIVSRETGKWIRGSFSYTIMDAKGISEYEDQGLNYAQWGFAVANSPFYLSWDQRHTVKADIVLDLPLSTTANIIWQYHNGRPYTYYPSQDGFTPDNPDILFLPNNRRMPANNFLDLKVSKEFKFGHILKASQTHRYKVALYVECKNVFNQKNVRWIDSSGRIGGELSDPSAYYTGRRTALGVEIEL
ncbi:TonB-dependent receptor [candidate division KSB1 bacterium]|nr:TonB-dependent receptor [candidate division KSB1 bacterium]